MLRNFMRLCLGKFIQAHKCLELGIFVQFNVYMQNIDFKTITTSVIK